MPSETFVLEVLKLVLPPAIQAIEGLRWIITSWLQQRKERNLPVEEGLQEALDDLVFEINFFKGLSLRATNKQDRDAALQVWVEKLKEILCDAEDLLDEFATDAAVLDTVDTTAIERKGMQKVRETLLNIFFPFKNTSGSSQQIDTAVGKPKELVNRIKDIVSSLANIEKKAALLGLEKSETDNRVNLEWRQTTSTPEEYYPMVGRDDAMEKIKQDLLQVCGQDREEKKVDGTPSLSSSSSSSTVSQNQKRRCLYIISIVGMGGMGKTTLARNVFNDNEMQSLFDLPVWLCVSENFEKSSILKRIIDRIYHLEKKEKSFQWTGLEELEKELGEVVQGKKVLLVLDDIWNEEPGEWERLVTPLQAAAQNSKGFAILITSRIRNIKDAIPGCMEAIRLEGLREDDLWTVFERYAFCDSTDLNRVERGRFERIGRDIFRKLKGSPLAAKSVGTLLASNRSTEHWNDVAGSELWKVPTSQLDIIPILTLSYRYLDAHLKNFLVYFSLFPKDYVFEELKIVQLWMAHNSFQCQGNTQEVLEDAGRKYLNLLVGRSFLEYNNGRYTMHDLIHDTIQSVFAHHCCLLEHGSDIRNDIDPAAMGGQHLSVCCYDGLQYVYKSSSKLKKLRTLMISSSPHVEFSKITHMTCLKVLVLKDCGMKELPESVGCLKHLRLLDLSNNGLLEKLPESIGFLYNLLVLDLEGCYKLKRVPSTMSRLVKLRYLYMEGGLAVKGIGRLISLRSDLWFNVKQESGFYINELKYLNELKGSLEIKNLDLVRSQEDAEAAHICKKMHLQSLVFQWSYGRDTDFLPFETVAREEKVLEALKPCQAIKDIEISGYGGRKPPCWLNDIWLVSSIRLFNVNIEYLPPSLSKMPFLKKFSISKAPKLKEMRWQTQAQQVRVSDSSVAVAFLMLEELYLKNMRACKGFQFEEKAGGKPPVSVILPKLKLLDLYGCPHLEEWFPIQAPVLQKLSIKSVPLYILDSFLSSGLTYLRYLHIRCCWRITSCDLSALTSLKRLHIVECENITSCRLPPAPAALESLLISRCHRMEAVWLSSPALSINSLHIEDCPKLLYFGTNPSNRPERGIYYCWLLHIIVGYFIYSFSWSSNRPEPGSPRMLHILGQLLLASYSCWLLHTIVGYFIYILGYFRMKPSTDDQSSSFSWSSNRPEHSIHYCPRTLNIEKCSRKQLSRLLHAIYYTKLETLSISTCLDIEHFNDAGDLQLSTAMLQLTSLKTLLIADCGKLQSLPPDMGSKLLCLERIKVYSCPLLSSLP